MMTVLQTKLMQTLVLDPGGFLRSSTRLPVFGIVASVTLWGGSRFGMAGGDLECFLAERGPQNIIFRSKVQATRMNCGRSLFSPQPGWFEYAMPGYGSWGGERMSGSAMKRGARWQGTPRSDVRSGAARIRCYVHIIDLEVDPTFVIYKCYIMLIKKGWCLIDPLYCFTVTKVCAF